MLDLSCTSGGSLSPHHALKSFNAQLTVDYINDDNYFVLLELS